MTSPTKTYAATRADGSPVRVSVPEDPTPAEALADAIKDNLSPEAVVVLAVALDARRWVEDPKVDAQVRWFRDLLTRQVSRSEFSRICKDLQL